MRKRPEKPISMRFQERDGKILWAIYSYEGVLARRHIKAMFWKDKSLRAMQRRMSKLFENGYIDRTTTHYRTIEPSSEPIYWLDLRGIRYIADRLGEKIEPPKRRREHMLRSFQRDLRERGVHWVRKPRKTLSHHFAVVDFRLGVEKAVNELQGLSLETWIPERIFRSETDEVAYKLKGKDGEVVRGKRGVIPDGYFVLVSEKRQSDERLPRARFLVEIDMGTHDSRSFAREKVAAGVAYIRKSPQYKARFGINYGHWLVATTGNIRLKNLMRTTKRAAEGDSDLFFFTTFEALNIGNIFTEPIWLQPGKDNPKALFPELAEKLE